MDTSQIIHEITDTFMQLAAIPHPSGQEQALSTHLANLLRSRGGTVEMDDHGNLRCDFPATAGLDSAPMVCIQGHSDMVYVPQPCSVHCRVQDGWLESDGRSPLGAGSLLALTAALWLLQQPFAHGPVRILLTTGGEQGMTGAQVMNPQWLNGVRYLIGTDGLQLGQLTTGASAGCCQSWSRPLTTTVTQEPCWKVTFTGFPGGHSALDLDKKQINPIRLLGMLLIQSDVKIVSLSGGSAWNVIPSEASAVITIKDPNIFTHWKSLVRTLGGWMEYEPFSGSAAIWSPIDQQAALDFLLSLPSGITARLPEHPELPACSSNIGRVDCADNKLTYHVLLRGTPQQALDRAASGCGLVADRCGFDLTYEIRYPTWEGDRENPLAQQMLRLWQTRNQTPMTTVAAHAGSELSILTKLRSELPAVSTGITIEHPHSLRERAKLADLPVYVQLLQDTLELLAQQDDRKGHPMKLISWNVNGLRACLKKGFEDVFHFFEADLFCLQETKLQADQITLDLPGYHQYWNYAEQKGYSGTAVFSKQEPLSVRYGLGISEFDTEGRLITLEFEEFYFVCCYTPNAQSELKRIDYRMTWEDALQSYLQELDKVKPVVYAGDLNVAHTEIDLKNPKRNRGNPGFSDQEREKMTQLLSSGFTDTFRHLYPDRTGAYSWWSYRFNARKNNAGWRIDYFIVSDRLVPHITGADIYPEILGSDHCPVGLSLDL